MNTCLELLVIILTQTETSKTAPQHDAAATMFHCGEGVLLVTQSWPCTKHSFWKVQHWIYKFLSCFNFIEWYTIVQADLKPPELIRTSCSSVSVAVSLCSFCLVSLITVDGCSLISLLFHVFSMIMIESRGISNTGGSFVPSSYQTAFNKSFCRS